MAVRTTQRVTFKSRRTPPRPGSNLTGSGQTSLLSAALAAGLSPGAQQSTTSLASSLPGFAFTQPTPTAAAAGATTGYDFASDPIFQQAAALIARTEEEAKASAIARKTQLAIQYGDASGLGLGATTEKTAAENPYSVLGSLKRSNEQSVTKLEDQLNKSNLYYSGWRGKELGNAATGYQQNRYNAQSRFQAGVQDIDTALQNALMQAEWSRLAQMQAQYQSGLANPTGASTAANGAPRDLAYGFSPTGDLGLPVEGATYWQQPDPNNQKTLQQIAAAYWAGPKKKAKVK